MRSQPPVKISCLHTAASNIAPFDAAAAPLSIQLTHCVRPDLLAEAQISVSTALAKTSDTLSDLCTYADVVVLTCSTLGPAADSLSATLPVLRADRRLAEHSLQGAASVLVLCTAPSTLAPTAALFAEVAAKTGGEYRVELVPGAWAAFQSGDLENYYSRVATGADQAFAMGFAQVAFAQVSMTPAADMCMKGHPLVIPPLALRAALAVAQGERLRRAVI